MAELTIVGTKKKISVSKGASSPVCTRDEQPQHPLGLHGRTECLYAQDQVCSFLPWRFLLGMALDEFVVHVLG